MEEKSCLLYSILTFPSDSTTEVLYGLHLYWTGLLHPFLCLLPGKYISSEFLGSISVCVFSMQQDPYLTCGNLMYECFPNNGY